MKRLLMALALLLAAGCEQVGQAPNTVARLQLADYQGRWVVLNYWAIWCKPCIEEIPELNLLEAKYPQVAVLGVNFDGATGEDLQEQMSALAVGFPVLLEDPATSLGIPLPQVLPTTLILNPDGALVHTLVGPQTLESLALATGQLGMVEAGPSTEDILDTER